MTGFVSKRFENIVAIGENTGYRQLFFFLTIFPTPSKPIPTFLGVVNFVEHKMLLFRGVRGREVERWPCNHEVPSSSPGSGSQLWDFSLAHTFGASTGVVPRKQNGERLV